MKALEIVLLAACAVANAYFLFAIFAARDFFRKRRAIDGGFLPPVSILKPMFGVDPDGYRSLASFFRQDYPRYEIVFAVASERDPAVELIGRLMREFPRVDARLVVAGNAAHGSPKVANLACAAAHAKYSLILVSDADIRVEPLHLRAMVQPLTDPGVGVVTCLYRSEGRGIVGTIDALGLSTEFQREVLVARKVEGISFAMGSGILLRREVLARIGGFEAVSHHLADDFLLGNLPAKNGHRVEFAHDVVDHVLATRTLSDLVRHQLRWNRGIRVSRPGGYAGLVVTHGIALALIFLAASRGSAAGWLVLAATVGLRLASTWIISVRLLADRGARRALWLVPFRDALSFLMWIGGFFGSSIFWRGQRFRLERNGYLTADTRSRPSAGRAASPPPVAAASGRTGTGIPR